MEMNLEFKIIRIECFNVLTPKTIDFGFTSIFSGGIEKPQCLICLSIVGLDRSKKTIPAKKTFYGPIFHSFDEGCRD